MSGAQLENYENGKTYELEVDQLNLDPDQPRKHIDKASLAKLANSIARHGILQPVVFRKDESGKFVIVIGERRVLATRKAGIRTIQAKYFEGDHEEAALAENIYREDLSPLEQAIAFQKLKDEKKYTDDGIASLFGKGRTTISEIISLNDLPDDIKDVCLKRPDIPRRELLKIKRVNNAERQKERFEALVERYDNIRHGTSNRSTRRDKVVIVEEMIDGLIQKLTNVREGDRWTAEDRAGLRDKIIALKEELENHTVTDE